MTYSINDPAIHSPHDGFVANNENHRKARFLNAADKTADFTIWADDTPGNPLDVYYVDCTSGNVTVTLPALADDDPTSGRAVKIVRVDSSANTLLIDADGSETIEGVTTVSMENQWDVQTLGKRTATDWGVLQGRIAATTVSPAFGEISVDDNSGGTPQTIGTSFEIVTQFDVDGVAVGATADSANDKITATNSGTYRVACSMSFSGTGNTAFTVNVYVNGVAAPGLRFTRKIGSGGDVGSSSLDGLVAVGAGHDVEVFVKADGASKSFLIWDANLSLSRVSN